MQVKVSVRSRDGSVAWTTDRWGLLVAAGAVMVEPETLDEFAAGMSRYIGHLGLKRARAWTSLEQVTSRGQPWCLIDLVGRTLVKGEGAVLPQQVGWHAVAENEPYTAEARAIWWDLPETWRTLDADPHWEARVAARAARARPRCNVLETLYGPPLLNFLAAAVHRMLAEADEARAGRGKPGPAGAERGEACGGEVARCRDDEESCRPGRSQQSNSPSTLPAEWLVSATRSVHAAWLTELRPELNGRTPRQVIVANRSRLDRDLEHRGHQWARQGSQPAEVAPEALTYRSSGLTTAEGIVYFHLVRALLQVAWRRARQPEGAGVEELARLLVDARDDWLDTPFRESGYTAREIIDLQRRRIPLLSRTPLDCDCPLCLAQHAPDSPSFLMMLDSELDQQGDFVFSLYQDEEDWEQVRGGLDPLVLDPPRGDGRRARGKRGGSLARRRKRRGRPSRPAPTLNVSLPMATSSSVDSNFVTWSSLASQGEWREAAMMIGFPVTEVVSQLREEGPVSEARIEAINEAYVRFYVANGRVERWRTAEALRDVLQETGLALPSVAGRCAAVQARLEQLLQEVAKE